MPLNGSYLDLLAELTPLAAWDSEKRERFSALYDLLLETNSRVNVTSLTGEAEVVLKHFADSLTLLAVPALREPAAGARFCDLGCGAGFPGLPLAIARPGVDLTMVDSTEKKIRALEENVRRLGLSHITALCARGEEMGLPGSPLRESFDVVVSRAVAPLSILTELCLPLVKTGGVFIAMKGAVSEEDRVIAARAAGQLGGCRPEIQPVSFPAPVSVPPAGSGGEVASYLDAARHLVVIRKKEPTPHIFPRSWAKMKKKPL